MAQADMNLPGRGGEEPAGGQPTYVEIDLTNEELDDLFTAVSAAFRQDVDAHQVLNRIGFPGERIPTFTGRSRDAWNTVFFDFGQGIIDAPYLRVLAAALRVYQRNQVLVALADRHGVDPYSRTLRRAPTVAPASPDDTGSEAATAPEPAPAQAVADPTVQGPSETCHVIISAHSEDDRLHAEAALRATGLDPRTVWSTGTAISFAVASSDDSGVRRILDGVPELGWTVVPRGQPDYLLRNLLVEGPDRRQFRVTDTPAHETFRDIAEEVIINHYPQQDPNAELPTMIEHVRDGERRSVNPDTTLHDAGVQDGDQMNVAYRTDAGGVHPTRHEAALLRARNQIIDFAGSPTARDIDLQLGSNAPLDQIPTAYELEFTQRSFSFPPGGSAWDVGNDPEAWRPGEWDVIEIDRHVVSLQLGPEFPQTPPQLWWMTPILHPNIYPNYPSLAARQAPDSRGVVCLGILGEAWQDAMDFGDLCRMLVEMAGFRNYSPFLVVLNTDGVRELKGNAYDQLAAVWVMHNQDRIKEIGGENLNPHRTRRHTYRNVIEETTGSDTDDETIASVPVEEAE